MSRLRFSVLVILLLALVSESCGGSDSGSSLEGQWVTPYGGSYMSYGDDGVWRLALSPDSETVAYGTYTFDGQRLVYTDTQQGANCVVGSTGEYDVEFTGTGDFVLTLVEDQCSERAKEARGQPFVRYSP